MLQSFWSFLGVIHRLSLLVVLLFLCPAGFAQIPEIGFDELSVPIISSPTLREHPSYVTSQATQPVGPTQKTVGALLLKTGYVVSGVATLEQNIYQVQGQYGRFSVPTHRVEFAGTDLHDLLQYKRKQIIVPGYDEVFALAKWCLANGLHEEAIGEFERCKSFVSVPQAIRLLDNEIKAAERATAPFREMLSAQQTANPTADDEDDFDYDNWGKSVPYILTERFRKEVQPIIVSRCSATDCHGPAAQQELTFHIPQRTYTTAEATARNMKAAMEQIDFDYPVRSPLLTVPLRNHGGTKPIFNKNSPKSQNAFERWIELVSQETPESLGLNRKIPKGPREMLQLEEPDGEQMAVLPRPVATVPNTSTQQTAIQQVGYTESKPHNSQLQSPPQSARSKLKPTPQPLQYRPESSNDPFDPALFNNKYYR